MHQVKEKIENFAMKENFGMRISDMSDNIQLAPEN